MVCWSDPAAGLRPAAGFVFYAIQLMSHIPPTRMTIAIHPSLNKRAVSLNTVRRIVQTMARPMRTRITVVMLLKSMMSSP